VKKLDPYPIAHNPKKFLGVFVLAMLSVSAIISLRNLSTTALIGTQVISFFLIAGCCFFVPVALVCAELATGWPKEGGVYLWVEEAFGKKVGFLAVWLQWMESVVWLPTILSFIATTCAYLLNPALESNRLFLVSIMLFILWGTTFLNFTGIRVSSVFSTIGVILGTLLPGLVLIVLGCTKISAAQSAGWLNFSADTLIPKGDLGTLVTFTSILLGLCGMEVPAYYVQEVENPQKSYPKAIFLATILILSISILGSLSITAMTHQHSTNIIAGPMQAFHLFFTQLGLNWVAPSLAALTLLGSLALLNTWIMGPSRGFLCSGEQGLIPKVFTHVNAASVPTNLLYLQAVFGSLLISIFVLSPSIKAAYWMINTLAAQLYLMMYILVFLAIIKLRYSQPNTPRPFKIPGGKWGVWFIGGLGAFSSLLAFLIGFVRPTDIEIHHSAFNYAVLLSVGITVSSAPPLILCWLNRRKINRPTP